jgi:4-hydroxy-tetrahydrodipicolinate synthase
MTTTRRPGGVIVPAYTPIAGDGKVDAAALRKLVARCVSAGAEAIFVGGSAGMGPMLTESQWEAALATVLETAGDSAPVLSGIIAPSTQRALLEIEASRRLGCGTIVVTPTFYITIRSHDEMLSHFRACREATDQQMVIYNIPSCTGSSIPIPVVRAAAERGWATALKESSGDRSYFAQAMDAVRGTEMVVLQGNEPDIAWGLRGGAAGIVPVCANCEPAPFVDAVRAARARDWARLDELQKRIDLIRDTILVGDHNWISGMSCALNVLGIGNGAPLLPLQPVGSERRGRIERYFAAHRGAGS